MADGGVPGDRHGADRERNLVRRRGSRPGGLRCAAVPGPAHRVRLPLGPARADPARLKFAGSRRPETLIDAPGRLDPSHRDCGPCGGIEARELPAFQRTRPCVSTDSALRFNGLSLAFQRTGACVSTTLGIEAKVDALVTRHIGPIAGLALASMGCRSPLCGPYDEPHALLAYARRGIPRAASLTPPGRRSECAPPPAAERSTRYLQVTLVWHRVEVTATSRRVRTCAPLTVVGL